MGDAALDTRSASAFQNLGEAGADCAILSHSPPPLCALLLLKINNGFRTEVFRRLGLTGSSGDWERLVRGVIQEFEENNSGVDLFHFDSDEDVFCVYSQYIDDLMLLSKMIRAACDNEKTMGMYLNMSEVAKA